MNASHKTSAYRFNNNNIIFSSNNNNNNIYVSGNLAYKLITWGHTKKQYRNKMLKIINI